MRRMEEVERGGCGRGKRGSERGGRPTETYVRHVSSLSARSAGSVSRPVTHASERQVAKCSSRSVCLHTVQGDRTALRSVRQANKREAHSMVARPAREPGRHHKHSPSWGLAQKLARQQEQPSGENASVSTANTTWATPTFCSGSFSSRAVTGSLRVSRPCQQV